jgi:hypothetical protein
MSTKRAAAQRGDLRKEKAPAIGGGPESCCELFTTLLRARPGPPSVVPEEVVIIGRSKREVAHGGNDIIALQKCKEQDKVSGASWHHTTKAGASLAPSD